MDFPIIIIWMSPLSFLGALGVIFSFLFFDENQVSKQKASDGTPHFAASHLGLFCLLMSHKMDARLICVNHSRQHD